MFNDCVNNQPILIILIKMSTIFNYNAYYTETLLFKMVHNKTMSKLNGSRRVRA